ncbi:hypothetical protein P618_200784 [Holospora obtusa F1]|uniref:Sodium:proton antiporter n=1 Tax=Holospora obtusa F1 TaxID=1399147 RepID=W6TDD0_HOLOB|nr:sodium:proton antiporter [Holospora obtusa]ETZ07013.1 hypothetical protein P618_200784 [Holospora obtusa F1]
MHNFLHWVGISLPFFILLAFMVILPQWAKHHWECYHKKYILGLIGSSVIGSSLLDQKFTLYFVDSFCSEYLPFILFLGCLYGLSCGIHVKILAHPSPKWNTLSLFLGTITAAVLGTTGACVIWGHALLQLNVQRRYKTHTMIFLIFCVANVGGIFSSLGDPPLLLGFLKGVPFLWATKHLTLAGIYVSSALLGVYYLIDKKMYNRESLTKDFSSFSVQIKGVKCVFALVFLTFGVVLIQKYSTQTWKLCSGNMLIHSSDIYRISFLSLVFYGIQRKKKLLCFSSDILKELSWTFFGLFMCVVPVIQWLSTAQVRAFLQIKGKPKILFWVSGMFSSFLDNAPTYMLCVEIAGGFQKITTNELKHVAFGTVMMGAMTYLGNAPNLLVKSIAEHHGVLMPSYADYMKWSFLILFPILFVLIQLIPNISIS